jgi:nucleotide-binding universal stress UspA family protein
MNQYDKNQKYILAIDGSENSLAAIDYVANIHLPVESKICVIAVLDTPHTLRRQLLLAALEQASNILKAHHQNIECGLLHGHPASTIIDFANDYKPDLIILGAKGLRATLGILLGGVAQQVVEHAQWPVLVYRHTNLVPHRFLVAVDGSDQTISVLNFLSHLPINKDAEWSLVHVVPPLPAYEPGNVPTTWYLGSDVFRASPIEPITDQDDWIQKNDALGNNILDQAINSLNLLSIQPNKILLHGDAATEILEYSHNNSIDMIFVGSRGLSAVQGWLLGSVSRKLVHYARCSVLIVK